MRDLEVLDYFFSLLQETVAKLESAVTHNDLKKSEELKKTILKLNEKIMEELRWK